MKTALSILTLAFLYLTVFIQNVGRTFKTLTLMHMQGFMCHTHPPKSKP